MYDVIKYIEKYIVHISLLIYNNIIINDVCDIDE